MIQYRVTRLGNTYTVSPVTDGDPPRGTRLGRYTDSKQEAIERAERAATKHARQAGGTGKSKKGQWAVRRVGDQFVVEKVT